MTDSAARRVLTELFAGHGWPEGGDELLTRSLGPRGPELLPDAPGWLGLGPGQLVLDAGCRDATHAVALARRYGCRVVAVDQATVEAAIAAAGFTVVRREPIASEWSEHQPERDPGFLTPDLLAVARPTRDRDRLEAALGPVWYRRALGFALWARSAPSAGCCRCWTPWPGRGQAERTRQTDSRVVSSTSCQSCRAPGWNTYSSGAW